MVLALYTVCADFLKSHIYDYIKVRTEATGTCSHPHPYKLGVTAVLNYYIPFPLSLHPDISCSPGLVESFDIPEASASSFMPPEPI